MEVPLPEPSTCLGSRPSHARDAYVTGLERSGSVGYAYVTHKIAFKDYQFVRTDRINSIMGRGIAIMIRNEIPFKIVKCSSCKSNDILEFAIIKVITHETKTLYLISF